MGRSGACIEIGACARAVAGHISKGRGRGYRARGAPRGPAGWTALAGQRPAEGATERSDRSKRPRKPPPQGGGVAAEVERPEGATEVSGGRSLKRRP